MIGVGDPERGDDGAGIRAARLVRARLGARVRVAECAGGAAELLEAWDGAARVIVVDATLSGAEPGTVCRLDAARGPLPAGLVAGSTHGLGVAEAVELARVLGRLPRALVVYGVEGRSFGPGAARSPGVEAGIRAAARAIVEEVG